MELFQNVSQKKKYFKDIIAIAFFSSYAYMSHSRGIVILIAAFITTLGILFLKKKLKLKSLFIFIAIIIFLFIIDIKTNGYIRQAIFPYGNANINSDVSSVINIEKLKNVLTLDGLKTVFRIIVGWCYNIFASSFGLAALGILMIIIQIIEGCRHKDKCSSPLVVISVFGALFFIGAFVTGALFFFDDIRYYYGEVSLRRCDKLIYGRYIEPASMILCFLGLYMLIKQWKAYKGIIAFIAVVLLLGVFAADIANRMNGVISWTHTSITVNGFCNLADYGRGMVTIENYSEPLIIMGIVSAITFGIIIFLRKRLSNKWIYTIYLFAFFLIYVRGITNVLIPMDNYYYGRVSEVKVALEDLGTINDEHKIIYLKDELLRCAFQYSFPDYYIVTDRDENKANIDKMFVVSETPLSDGQIIELSDFDDTRDKNLYIYWYEKE